MISPDHVCIYCKKTLAEHTESGINDEWKMCSDRQRVVHVTGANFRKPGPTITCIQCGHEQALPENIARHLGQHTGCHRP